MTRLLIFAQAPPPVHGQSVMVGHLLDGLRATGHIDLEQPGEKADGVDIRYVHINPQISDYFGDIGRWRPGKILRVFGFIWKAISARFRHRLDTFYFVPAPPKREALYRDFVVLLLCRPFFRHLILHWHCIGQPPFLEKLSTLERILARLCYGGCSLSIALSHYSENEAAYFSPRQSCIVPNGIPDPCPEYDTKVLPERSRRFENRQAWVGEGAGAPPPYDVLFMAGRMTPKGLFDAIEAVKLANEKLSQSDVLSRIRLTVAGSFEDDAERARFVGGGKRPRCNTGSGNSAPLCLNAGWADEVKKHALYRAADCFLFPTIYPAESFGLVLAEAMGHGCAVVTTQWQAVPEVLPPGDPNVIEPHDISAMATALLRTMAAPPDRILRDYFLQHFTRERFVADMVRVLGRDFPR